MQFSKYHALGADYVVIEATQFAEHLTLAAIRRICAAHCGIGADGVLVREANLGPGRFQVRIVNAEGKEAERASSGLRVFARYLFDRKEVNAELFHVVTPRRTASCQVADGGRSVSVDLGQVQFESHEIPVVGPPREVISEPLFVLGQRFEYTAVYVGSPHCVVPRDRVSEGETKIIGPLVETDRRFPNLTNVQFLQVLDRKNLRVETWERGSGYAPASGSGSCAAAAVARRLGLCEGKVEVHMPGGGLMVEVADDFTVRLSGPVVKVAEGTLSTEMF